MGRIRSTFIKKQSKKLIEDNPDKFGDNFDSNKNALKEIGEFDSPKTRNKIAGYMVRVAKKKAF